MATEIHGRILEEHDYGNIIYYDNLLIKSKSQKINELTTFEDWKRYISANPNFCGCKYHKNITCLRCKNNLINHD